MDERERVELGSKWGRWTVVRRATPAPRYGARYARARVHVRCVCGRTAIAWVCDLQAANTSGCRSATCRARFAAAEDLRARLETVIREFLEERSDE